MTAADMTENHSTQEPSTTPSSEPEKIPVNWWQEAKSISLLILAVLAFHSFVAKPFYIPSESMMPVLLKGDRLVVSKFPYGWSYVSPSFHPLPFLKGRIFGHMPQRGDIVIVSPQNKREDYIKRVIGLPGDILEVRGGQVVLNGVPVPQKVLKPIRIPVDGNAPCPAMQFPGALMTDANGKSWCELPVRQEVLPNGKSYVVIDMGPSTLDWYGPVRIPEGHVFLMGDNRDNSADSRAPLEENGLGGPVPWEAIGGRAEFITFSLDGDSSWNPLSWLHAFRSGRAGNSLRPASVAVPK
ncbi:MULTISPECIES: signal peptidase I [Sphingobium]|uniref:Signal peptidase I n=1 Tax=Sphingobium chungbukense TaxID=56193 RepID=A0A0M3AY42_9SPHN|nr:MULTISPECIES: signal peptidase I [Sphingobium]KKW93831.1 signal peptidase I [Sphingobium chungbukense]PJG48292.1 S26 family signal peptidase [Sphingobium sp. LB126]